MKNHQLMAAVILSAITFVNLPAKAQTSAPPLMAVPPVTAEEKEAYYNNQIEYRTLKIMQALAISDSAKSNRLHDVIFAHYHALWARDEAIDAELSDVPGGTDEWLTQRNAMFLAMSQPLHERFIYNLSRDLTPAQLETVKDLMTYGKVKFTYNAYCSIIPNLTDSDKAKILELLKQARELAMDGGSSGEKSDIFQRYKGQINNYLKSEGIDVQKAIQEWSGRQQSAKK